MESSGPNCTVTNPKGVTKACNEEWYKFGACLIALFYVFSLLHHFVPYFSRYINIYIYISIYDPGLAGPPCGCGCGFSCGWEMWPLSLHCLIMIDVEWSGAHSVVEHGWARPNDHHKSYMVSMEWLKVSPLIAWWNMESLKHCQQKSIKNPSRHEVLVAFWNSMCFAFPLEASFMLPLLRAPNLEWFFFRFGSSVAGDGLNSALFCLVKFSEPISQNLKFQRYCILNRPCSQVKAKSAWSVFRSFFPCCKPVSKKKVVLVLISTPTPSLEKNQLKTVRIWAIFSLSNLRWGDANVQFRDPCLLDLYQQNDANARTSLPEGLFGKGEAWGQQYMQEVPGWLSGRFGISAQHLWNVELKLPKNCIG